MPHPVYIQSIHNVTTISMPLLVNIAVSINTLPMRNRNDKVTLSLGLCPNFMLYNNDFVVNDRRTRKVNHLRSCQNWQHVEWNSVVFINCIIFFYNLQIINPCSHSTVSSKETLYLNLANSFLSL